ncbi:MAG: hypothetical protein V3U88_11280 [Methylococcales bacterium]
MIKTILLLLLLQSLSVQADVTHHIKFCVGNFCADTTPLTITQQLELNQQFEEGNLLASPTNIDTLSNQSPTITTALPNTPQ